MARGIRQRTKSANDSLSWDVTQSSVQYDILRDLALMQAQVAMLQEKQNWKKDRTAVTVRRGLLGVTTHWARWFWRLSCYYPCICLARGEEDELWEIETELGDCAAALETREEVWAIPHGKGFEALSSVGKYLCRGKGAHKSSEGLPGLLARA